MGIARRKAGTVVSCPTCQGQVVVPTPEPAIQPVPLPPPAEAGGPSGNVFERHDFDPALFNPNPVPAPAQVHVPVGAHPATVPARQPDAAARSDSRPLSALPDDTPANAMRRARGVVLSPTRLVLATIAIILLVIGAFGLGIVVGKWL
jgi:hypothetical protein